MRKVQFQTDIIEAYLDNIPLPKLTNEQTLSCEVIISKDEVLKSLKSMDTNKSPGNDGLSKKLYECFWDEVKKPFLASIHKAFPNQELSTSQKQAVIKREKRTKIRDSLKPGGPLRNTDMKIISKVLSTKIKGVLPYLISSNQTAYVKNRFISKSGRLILDILEIAETLELEGFLVTRDVEKAFDSVDHCFLLQILRKLGFGIDFVSWIKTILKNQESCTINGGKQQNISNSTEVLDKEIRYPHIRLYLF